MQIIPELIDSIVAKTGNEALEGRCAPYLMTFDDLESLVNPVEQDYIQELLRQKPSDYGISEPFRGIEPVPSEMVAIENQQVTYDEETIVLGTKYLPRVVYEAYERLRQDYKSDSGKNILVGSGYRSPAYQAVNVLRWLKIYKFDFKKTLGFVSLAGYSEHSLAEKTAIDFMTEEGIGVFDEPPFGRFDETPEYSWLLENAGKHNFVLTCPVGNAFGFQFEPWHWQFQGK